jgi:hypothetical protein
MGFIRGSLLVIATVLIFISLLAGNIFWTISSSLEYNNVKSGIISISNDIFQEDLNINEKLEEIKPQMDIFCQQNPEYIFNYGGQTITMPCETVLNEPENMVEEAVENLIERYYYQEYNCNFFNCFEKGEMPFFLISEKAHDYWKSKFYWTISAIVILAVAMFFLTKKKTNFPIILGGVIILSAIPLTKIENIASSLLKFLGNLQEYVLKIVMLFFSGSNKVFLIMFIIGIAVLLGGIVLKIMKTSISLMNFFSKFKRSKNKEVKFKQEKPEKPKKEKKSKK